MIKSLSDFISRNGKIILAVWLIIMLVLIPSALSSFDNMAPSLVDTDEETNEGMKIVEQYFNDPVLTPSSMPMLVINYTTARGYQELLGNDEIGLECYTDFLADKLNEDENWFIKLDGEPQVIREVGDSDSGVIVVIIKYRSQYSQNYIREDTDDLRTKVQQITDDYLYELYEKDPDFKCYLTGADALMFDVEEKLIEFAIISVVLVIIIGLLLMWLIFGSMITSIIPIISVLSSIVMSAAIIYMVSTLFIIPIGIGISVFGLVVLITFADSILIVSNYKKALKTNNENESIQISMENSSKVIILSSLFILICSVIALFSNYELMISIGICLLICAIVTMIVSLIVTPSLIALTKNEVFWKRSSEKKFKFEITRKINAFFKTISNKIINSSDTICTKHSFIVIGIVALLILSSLIGAIVANPLNSESNEFSEIVVTGESGQGFNVLCNNDEGGLMDPYVVALKFDEPIAYIERDFLFEIPLYRIIWNSDDISERMDEIRNEIVSSDKENLSYISSIIFWDSLVAEAKSKGITDPMEIIESIRYTVQERDSIASVVLNKILDLAIGQYTAEFIVNYGAPYIDYYLNCSLGRVGFTMNTDNEIPVQYVKFLADSKTSPTNMKTIKTTESIMKTVDEMENEHQSGIEKSWVYGTPVSYKKMTTTLNEIFFIIVISIILIALFVIAISKFDIKFILISIITMITGLIITTCLGTLILNWLFNGHVPVLIIIVIPMFYLIISTFFGIMQSKMLEQNENIFQMKRQFVPTTMIMSIMIILSSILFLFADIGIVSQIGIIIIISLLIDVFIIRFFFAPALMSVMKCEECFTH